MKMGIAIITMAGLILVGCSSGDSEVSSDTKASQTETTESYTAFAPSEELAESMEPVDAPDIPGKVVMRGETSSCTSDTSSSGPVDLVGVDVELGVAGYAGTAARVRWRLSGPLPTTGTALLSLMAASQDGNTLVQLGYKALDGEQIGYYVFADGSQSNLAGFPDTRVPTK